MTTDRLTPEREQEIREWRLLHPSAAERGITNVFDHPAYISDLLAEIDRLRADADQMAEALERLAFPGRLQRWEVKAARQALDAYRQGRERGG